MTVVPLAGICQAWAIALDGEPHHAYGPDRCPPGARPFGADVGPEVLAGVDVAAGDFVLFHTGHIERLRVAWIAHGGMTGIPVKVVAVLPDLVA
jgi:hypothetical protein